MKLEDLIQPNLPTSKCTTGCSILDHFLSGGIPCNSITELFSESGCGKTQLCLQLLLSAQLPNSLGGLSASSLYLYSEFPFPFRRLCQLSHSFRSAHPSVFASYDPCDRVFVHPIHSANHLLDVLQRVDFVLGNLVTQFPTRLIVIDSIAALFRAEFDNKPGDLKKRSSLFFKISGKLKSLAKRFDLAVVVTNQVVDLVGGSSDGLNGLRIGNLRSFYSSGRLVCPALGLSWANCINSRLFLSRNDEIVREAGLVIEGNDDFVTTHTRRHIHVVFAPHLPDLSCEFVIAREGIFGVDKAIPDLQQQ